MMARAARRLGFAGALLCLSSPLMAATLGCPALRAMTNADGRNFADVRMGIGQPLTFSGRAARDAGTIVQPNHCSFETSHDDVSFTCFWPRGDIATTSRLHDDLRAEIAACLGQPIAAVGPAAPYGGTNATARVSRTELAVGLGSATVRVKLIEPGVGSSDSPYVVLSAQYEPAEDAADD